MTRILSTSTLRQLRSDPLTETKPRLTQPVGVAPADTFETKTSKTVRNDGDAFVQKKKNTFEQRLTEVKDAPGALKLIDAVLKNGDGTKERLQVHHVFDKARAGGYLDATLEQLKKTHPASEVVAELISQANPTIRPVEITHRGTIGDTFPENTMEGIKDAVQRGATGLEIDLSFTKDGKIVMWHDNDPADLTAHLRRYGLESGKFQPRIPENGLECIDRMTLAEVQRKLGYKKSEGDDAKLPFQVPTFDQVAGYLKEHPEVKTIALDVKIGGDRGLRQRFATELDRVLTENGLSSDRIFLMHPDKDVVKDLKSVLGNKYPLSHDIDIPALEHDPHSGVVTAKELDNSITSIGRQPFGLDAYDSFLESVERDRKSIESDKEKGLPSKKLYGWTLDDELEMREAIAKGVDGIVTNRPFMLQKLIRAYWPE